MSVSKTPSKSSSAYKSTQPNIQKSKLVSCSCDPLFDLQNWPPGLDGIVRDCVGNLLCIDENFEEHSVDSKKQNDLTNYTAIYVLYPTAGSFVINSETKFGKNLEAIVVPKNAERGTVTLSGNMSRKFQKCAKFDSPVDDWDVSSVTNMEHMFAGASSFNQHLNQWNVSNVTNMKRMFAGASSFNKDLNNWNVSNVTNMKGMFQGAKSFNGEIGNWDVSSVTSIALMFFGAYKFDKSLQNWRLQETTGKEFETVGFWMVPKKEHTS